MNYYENAQSVTDLSLRWFNGNWSFLPLFLVDCFRFLTLLGFFFVSRGLVQACDLVQPKFLHVSLSCDPSVSNIRSRCEVFRCCGDSGLPEMRDC